MPGLCLKDVASSTSPSATTGEAISVDLNTIQTVPSCPEPLITQSWSHRLTTNGETAIYPRPGNPPIFPSLFIHRTTISSLLCKKSPILNTHAKIPQITRTVTVVGCGRWRRHTNLCVRTLTHSAHTCWDVDAVCRTGGGPQLASIQHLAPSIRHPASGLRLHRVGTND